MAVSKSHVDRLRALDACAVSDALDKLGIDGCLTGLVASMPQRRIAGLVHTVQLVAGTVPENWPARHLGAAAVDACSAGDVIVVEQSTGLDAGSWGGILSQAAKLKGVAGVITNGPVRDVDEARDIGFPIFCGGFTCRTARGRIYEAATDVPVALGAVSVRPADYVLADSSGAVFLPADRIEQILDTAETIARREAEMTRRLKQGEQASAVLGADYEYMLTAASA